MDTGTLVGMIYVALRVAGLAALIVFAILEIRKERNK